MIKKIPVLSLISSNYIGINSKSMFLQSRGLLSIIFCQNNYFRNFLSNPRYDLYQKYGIQTYHPCQDTFVWTFLDQDGHQLIP